MPARWIAALVLSALAALVPLRAQSPGTRAVVARCAGHSPPLRGWKALHAACPGVGRALEQLQLDALLPRQWRRTLTSSGLGGLAALSRRYDAGPASALPDPAALLRAARRLAPRPPKAAPPSLWSRVVEWIHARIAPAEAVLRRSLQSLVGNRQHRERWYWAMWIGGAVLIVLALVAIAVQLGAARAPGSKPSRGPGRRKRTVAREAPALPPAGPDWSALRNQPSGLLQLLIDALVHAHRLDGKPSLTCREISALARFDDETQRNGFARIAQLAERQRYGPPATVSVPESTLLDARALHRQLGNAPARDDEDGQ